MKRLPAIILLSLAVAVLGGCVQFESKRGVEVNWKDAVTDKLVQGQSTRRDVLEVLGPPSQVIGLDNESISAPPPQK